MKKTNIITTLFATLITTGLFAQAGALDSTFGTGGKVITAIASNDDEAISIAVQPDGKIVAAGYAIKNSITHEDFAVVRYHPDGSLDTAFGANGIVTTDIGASPGSFDVGTCIALQPDGKTLVAGYSGILFEAVRYLPDGALDTSFNTDGKVYTAIGAQDVARAIALQSDEKIVIAGFSYNGTYNDIALLRYNPDGTLDNSFSTDGVVTTPVGTKSSFAIAMTIQPDGKIVVAGSASNGTFAEFALLRYHPNGTLDNSFSSDGKVTTAIGTKSAYAFAIALQSDDKIVAAGNSNNGTNDDFVIARYNPDGTLDSDFGTDGIVNADFGTGLNDVSNSVLLQPDGKIVAVGNSSGSTQSYIALARFHPDGTLDDSFGTGGKALIDAGAGNNYRVAAATLQSDGKIVIAGRSKSGMFYDMLVLRCLSGPSVGVIDAASTFGSPLIYPNPVSNGSLTLAYTLPAASPVNIELFDLQGHTLGTMLKTVRAAGENKEILRLPEGLPAGYYILDIQTERGNVFVKINALSR